MVINSEAFTPNKFIKTLSIIHFALLLGLLVFGGFTIFQLDSGITPAFDPSDILLLIYPVIVISVLVASKLIFKYLLAFAEKRTDLKSKLMSYQTALIIKFALIEGPAILGIVLSMITGNTAYIAIASVLIIYFLMQKPTANKIESDLNLRGEHRNQFHRYDEVIE